MSIEKKINQYGQEQHIQNFDKVIKIGNRFLQVRLIETEKWEDKGEFTKPMPRAKFVDPSKEENFYYLVNKKDLMELKHGNA